MLKLRKKKGGVTHFNIQGKCKYCKSDDLVRDNSEGNLVCRSCGRVNSMHNFQVDYGDYERTLKIENPLLGSFGLETTGIRGNGRNFNEKKLKTAFKKIDEMCKSINMVRKYISRAKEIYKNLWEKKALIRGNSKETYYATCIYVACKLEGSQRTLNEIVLISRVNQRNLGKCYKYVKKVLDLNKILNTIKKTTNSSYMINTFCFRLKLSEETTKVIHYCCNKIEDFSKAGKILYFQGKNPDTIISNVIYFICSFTSEDKRTVKEISEKTGKSQGTIRKCKKELMKYKEYIIPKDFIKKHNI